MKTCMDRVTVWVDLTKDQYKIASLIVRSPRAIKSGYCGHDVRHTKI